MRDATDILQWPFGRLDFSAGTLIMGILNVTPDSFSDGGLYLDTEQAVQHGLRMAAEGAAVIDVGAESSRPGSEPVSPQEQIRRAVPVIKALAGRVDVPISIDTYNPDVARAALDAGAGMVNDITALSDDRMAELVAQRQVPVVLMHMQGTPATMQQQPQYDNVLMKVLAFLTDRAQRAEQYGVPGEHIILDPGIGFGKTLEHNLVLLHHLSHFVATGYRVLIGASRKRFIGSITGKDNPTERVFGTAATVALCVQAGVSMVRVHDVSAMADVIKVSQAIKKTK
jgi:dihydropteroate synthase